MRREAAISRSSSLERAGYSRRAQSRMASRSAAGRLGRQRTGCLARLSQWRVRVPPYAPKRGSVVLESRQRAPALHQLTFHGTDSLFSVRTEEVARGVSGANYVDTLVRRTVASRLGSNRHIQFYLARFVKWNRQTLVLAIGGTTTEGETGPMRQYCYGLLVDLQARRVLEILSTAQRKARFQASCFIFP